MHLAGIMQEEPFMGRNAMNGFSVSVAGFVRRRASGNQHSEQGGIDHDLEKDGSNLHVAGDLASRFNPCPGAGGRRLQPLSRRHLRSERWLTADTNSLSHLFAERFANQSQGVDHDEDKKFRIHNLLRDYGVFGIASPGTSRLSVCLKRHEYL